MATGITKRHSRRCRSRERGRCNCEPTYEAWVYSKRDGKKIRKLFDREAEAKSWRADATSALSKGAMRAPTPTTVGQAWEAWEQGAKAGTVRNRSGDPYKPSALRRYEEQMRLRVLPELGGARLVDVRRADLQQFVYRLSTAGLDASTVRGTFLPLRAIFKHAVSVGDLAVNPCADLQLPAVRSRRERIADPQEAEALLAALTDSDRALWATAMYAGLRSGEIQALRWEDVDLAGGVIRVEHGWDAEEGEIGPKTSAGRRKVPIPAILRDYLVSHKAVQGLEAGLVFGKTTETPFDHRRVALRAKAAWKESELERITLHECRHTFASLMIAAGVNAKALSTYMGHANISITLDRYGHLMPGSEDEAARLLDTYLSAQRMRAEDAARAAAPVAG
jgi:integrase